MKPTKKRMKKHLQDQNLAKIIDRNCFNKKMAYVFEDGFIRFKIDSDKCNGYTYLYIQEEVQFTFRPNSNYAKAPLIRAPRQNVPKKYRWCFSNKTQIEKKEAYHSGSTIELLDIVSQVCHEQAINLFLFNLDHI